MFYLYNFGLKTLLQESMSESKFYDDLVDKSIEFKKIINRYMLVNQIRIDVLLPSLIARRLCVEPQTE